MRFVTPPQVEEMTALQKKVSALSAAKDKLSKQLEKVSRVMPREVTGLQRANE